MADLSDTSLRQVLDPVVIIIDAFKKASNWRAIKEAWKCSKLSDRCLFLGLTAIFAVLMVASISQDTTPGRYGFGALAIPVAVASFIVFRRRVVDSHPVTHEFGRFDHCFGLNYRFRRHLMFREDLLRGKIGAHAVAKARLNLQIEAKLLESRTINIGAGATMIISIITSILTTISTQRHSVESGLVYLILFGLVVGLYIYFFLKTVVPNLRHRELELECFLTWYEQELASASLEPSN